MLNGTTLSRVIYTHLLHRSSICPRSWPTPPEGRRRTMQWLLAPGQQTQINLTFEIHKLNTVRNLWSAPSLVLLCVTCYVEWGVKLHMNLHMSQKSLSSVHFLILAEMHVYVIFQCRVTLHVKKFTTNKHTQILIQGKLLSHTIQFLNLIFYSAIFFKVCVILSRNSKTPNFTNEIYLFCKWISTLLWQVKSVVQHCGSFGHT